MGQLKRQLVIWSAIAATTAVLPGLAMAENASPEHGGGRHGRGDRHQDSKLSVAGRAISRGTTDSYGLQIRGRSGDQPTEAGGRIRFGHRGEGGGEGLVGEITCLSKDSTGIVSVTGTIVRSGKRDKSEAKAPGVTPPSTEDDGTAFLDELAPWDADEADEPAKRGERGDRGRRGGGELAGKDFGFTIDVPGKPQKFSQPTIGDKGTLTACSGGGTPVEVTRGGFKTRDGDSDKAGDDDGRRGDRRGRRGWWRR